MNERIKMLRLQLGHTQQQFGERIGLKQNSIALVESGRRNISDNALISICREFHVSETWLRTGEGEMFLPDSNSALDALAAEYGLTPEEKIMIKKYLDLKPEIQQGILDYILAVADAINAAPELDIEAEVEAYRRELIAQKGEAARSSASDGRNAG